MTGKLKIEEKVDIAADAAISIHAYLEELNYKLIEAKIDNTFSICTDTEEMIVEMLTAVGSKTKLGADVVMQLIHDEFGTPDQFVRIYTNEQKINTDDTILIKRQRNNKIKITNFKGIFPTLTEKIRYMIKYIVVFSPIILLTVNFLIPVIERDIFYVLYYYIFEILIFTTLAASMQILHELFSGKTGKLVLTKQNTIRTRSIYKGLVLSQIIIALNILGFIERNSTIMYYTEINDDGIEYTYQQIKVNKYYDYFILENSILIIIITSIILAMIIPEIIIILRDHAVGFYPLEPNFKHSIRFLTTPYILLIISVYCGVNSDYYNDLGYGAILFSALSYLLVRIKKLRVSPRFKIILLTTMLIGFNYTNNWFYLFLLISVSIILQLLSKLMKHRQFFVSDFLATIKSKYKEYYDQNKFY